MIWKCRTSRILYSSVLSSAFDFAVVAPRFRFSFARNSSASSYVSRPREEDVNNVRVFVWWDFENCQVPREVNVLKIAQIITAAVRANGIKGPVQINAFGDVLQLSRTKQLALSVTGVNIHHVPRGGKNSADRSLIVNLMYWVSQNPPPAHLFLISGDSDFASVLHRLRMRNYNILLACSNGGSDILNSAASILWPWYALVKEKKLTGRYVNQPPDGPYSSWYGHYELPLEDSFLCVDPQSQSEDSIDKMSEFSTIVASKPCTVPPTLINQILCILSLYPSGISLSKLRCELLKSNAEIGDEYYAHKNFIQVISSLPHIMKFRESCDEFIVQRVEQHKTDVLPLKELASRSTSKTLKVTWKNFSGAYMKSEKEKKSRVGIILSLWRRKNETKKGQSSRFDVKNETKNEDIFVSKKKHEDIFLLSNGFENKYVSKKQHKDSLDDSNGIKFDDYVPNKSSKDVECTRVSENENVSEKQGVRTLKMIWGTIPMSDKKYKTKNRKVSKERLKDSLFSDRNHSIKLDDGVPNENHEETVRFSCASGN